MKKKVLQHLKFGVQVLRFFSVLILAPVLLLASDIIEIKKEIFDS